MKNRAIRYCNLCLIAFLISLSVSQMKTAEQHTRWLRESSHKLNEWAQRWQFRLNNIKKSRDPISAQKLMMEMNQSFNM
jgi:hypothetical protein